MPSPDPYSEERVAARAAERKAEQARAEDARTRGDGSFHVITRADGETASAALTYAAGGHTP